MSPPARLYKYQAFGPQSLTNLKTRQLWFSKPSRFNDPFDCRLRIDDHNLSDTDLQQVFEHLRARAHDAAEFEAKYLRGEKLTDQFREEVRRGAEQAFEQRLAVNLNERGVCCLSATVDSPLMWSHYSGGHLGFCLEFDTDCEPFNKAKRVRYSDSVPAVNVARALLNPADADFLAMVTTKASCWSYEHEWRILHLQADTSHTYPWASLTGLYFGALMEPAHKEIIAMILRDSPTKLYEAHVDDRSFSLSMSEVHYTPFQYQRDA